MEVLRIKLIFLILTFIVTHTNNEKPPSNIHNSTCPFSKIIEDIFQIKKHPGPVNTSERAKIFLHSIANITNTNKYKNITEEELVNDIIAAINRIKNNLTEEDSNDQKLNEAIVLFPNETSINNNKKVTAVKSGIEEKTDLNNVKKTDNKVITTTEKTNYVEILTIEPNNTQNNNKSNVTSHNIVEILKHFMPIFNTTKKDLHNITIIESNVIKNHSISASKNVSTIIVTYCDKDNNTNNVTSIKNNSNLNNDYYDDESPDPEEAEEEEIVTAGEKRDILEAAEYGMQKMHELYSVLEPKLYSMGLWLDETNPARYVAAFNAPSEDAARYTRYGYASLQAAAKLKELTSASGEGLEGRTEENQFPIAAAALRQSPLMQHCPLKNAPKCPPASKRYRTHDGTCNNINRPRWGSTMTPVQRFLPPSYSDGLQAPRRSVFGGQLPSAREISSLVHESKNVESPGITHLLMQWGQFVDHDVTSSSQSRGFNGSVPRCCRDGGRDFVPKELLHPECFPIPVPPSDPFYGPRRVRCLDFVRSSPAPRDDCSLGWRDQLNQVSGYIDGSPLYASSARQSDKLRLFRNGMLQYGRVQQRKPVLPPERRDDLCRGGAVSTECFKSGDGRVNEHPGLVAAHIVWLRHHNRMAQELAHLNPHWSDEKIYQETRKIVGAMVQHITYKEFLPIVLGSDVMDIFELDLLKKGYFKEYNPKINPSPASSFSSAAFRFGHSLVQPSMMRFDRFHRPMHNNVSLHNELTNPSNIWSVGAVDRLLLGMVNQPIQKRDEFITEELTNHLFQTPQFDFGMDLAAINIQRGRDHGVPPYTSWREPCGLSAILEFNDLIKVMPARAVRKLKVLYRHVDDIDLFTGGMAERPVVEGLVGPTFACIIAQQFSNLRRGDRFWYENGGFESSFTPAQLQQIRRISFAQILCHTLDSIDSIQPFAFLSADHPDNDRISCQNGILNNFDLSPWIEIDSESDNDIRKSEKITTQKPKRKKPTTPKPSTTTKAVKNSIKSTKKPHIKVSTTKSAIDRQTDNVNATTKENTDSNNTLTNKTNTTVQIDDKLDFKNKTKRFDDTDIDFRNRPTKQYNSDYDDDEDLSVQSVVINNSGYNKRPYNNYQRPILTVTENTNKYTYLINYVPRPTESYRHTTRRAPERDVVKVTYQTYDDTYRRPNRPYYYNNNYRHNRPNRRTTVDDNYMHSSARFNNDMEGTTTKSKLTDTTDDHDQHDKTDKTYTTTENLYKLVTFGYVGSYRGDAVDRLNMKFDQVPKTDDMTSRSEDLPLTEKETDKRHGIISQDFSTYTTKPDVTKDKTEFPKLSTFFTYDTSTKSYQPRSTRLNDDTYLYPKNNIYRPTDTDREFTTESPKIIKEIIKENYNNPGKPQVNIEERSSLNIMAEENDAVSKAAATKLRIKVKKPAGPAQTPSVAFQVIPSEVSPTQWAVYDEDLDLPEVVPHQMPPIRTDPHALKEIPRPISLIGLRRRRPGRF